MNVAIKELRGKIKFYDKQRQAQLEAFQSDKFRNNVQEPIDENVEFVIKHTNEIYDNYIAKIQKAIDVLERVGDSRRKRYRRRYR